MPAESKSQQRLFAVALSYKRGEVKDVSDRVKELAESMSESELEDFASTPHDGLPEKKAGIFSGSRNYDDAGNEQERERILKAIREMMPKNPNMALVDSGFFDHWKPYNKDLSESDGYYTGRDYILGVTDQALEEDPPTPMGHASLAMTQMENLVAMDMPELEAADLIYKSWSNKYPEVGEWLEGPLEQEYGYRKPGGETTTQEKKAGRGFSRPENWGKDYEKFNWEMYSGANDWELKNTWAWVNFKEDDGSVGAVKRVWFELEQPDGDTEKEWEAYDGNNTFHKALYKEAEKRAKEYAGEYANDSRTSKFDWERAFSDLAEDPSNLPGVKNSGIERSEFKEIKTAHLSLAKAASRIPFKVLKAIRKGDKSALREFGRRGGLSKAKPDFSETEQLLNRLKMLYHTEHKKLPSVKHVDSWLTKSSAAPQGPPVDPALLGLGVLGGGTFSGAALGSLMSGKGNKGRGTAMGGATGMGAVLGAAAPALFPGNSGGPPSRKATLASSALGALLANRIAAGLVGDKDAERAAVVQEELQNAMGQAR